RCREVEQGVQPFHTRVGLIALAQRVYQGQQQENIRAWTDGKMLTPALRAFRVTRVDPDDFATALLQAVENGAPSLQMHKTRLTDRRIGPQEHSHIGMLEIRQRMDERPPRHDLRPGKLVLAILRPRRKHIARAEGAHECEQGEKPQGVKRQWVAKVDTDSMGTVALQNRLQALRYKGHGLVPGDALIGSIRPSAQGRYKP